MKKNNNFDEERITKNFENINNWINNCDNKSSVILGFIGIIGTILLTNNGFVNIFIKLIIEVCRGINFSDVLYLLFLFGTILMIFYGILKIFKVICPTLKIAKIESNSLIYYNSISKMDFSVYKDKVLNSNDKDYINDLLNQIYINSQICSKKFNNFKCGFSNIIYGLIGFSILFIIGILLYL